MRSFGTSLQGWFEAIFYAQFVGGAFAAVAIVVGGDVHRVGQCHRGILARFHSNAHHGGVRHVTQCHYRVAHINLSTRQKLGVVPSVAHVNFLVPFRYVGAGHLLVVDHHGHPHRVDAGNHTVHTFLFAIFKYVI